MRVHELAKELGVSNNDLLKKLTSMGVKASSHSASVDGAIAEKLRTGATGGRQPKAGNPKAESPKAKAAKADSVSAPKQVKAPATVSAPVKPITDDKPAEPNAQTGKVISRSDAKRAELGAKHDIYSHDQFRSKRQGRGRRRRHFKHAAQATRVESPLATDDGGKVIEVVEAATVAEFAELVNKHPSDLIKTLMKMGEMKTINQPISEEAMHLIADELGYEIKVVSPEEMGDEEVEAEASFETRPPVVTVMGHVDHGKTSILDAIRQTEVAAGEAGGITQHIGAYQVVHGDKRVTFIDTPGHEAFTAMRARGANVTDVVVLVVAADDGVMPQTVEAINHAKAANVPIVVALNKIDKDNANPDRVRQELSEYGLIPEAWGGETVIVEVSAKKRIKIDELVEMILIVSELQELKSSRAGRARGACIESKLDRGRGPVATILISRGTLRIGDAFVSGMAYGRVRAINDDKGNPIEIATPAQPVEVIGFTSVPHAGDEFRVVVDDKTARQIAEERALKRRLVEAEKHRHITLEELHKRIAEGEVKDLNIIVKADVQGSIEAIRDALNKISERETEVRINTIHTGVGGITETDVMLGSASDAILIGFNVRPDVKAKAMAEQEKVDIRTYRVIYQLVEDISNALAGLLSPELGEVEQGRIEIRQIFKSSRTGVIAGCFVTDGEVERNSRARLVRDGTVVYEGQLSSLRRFKEDAKNVKAGFECGLTLEDFQDVKEGDVVEVYRIVERQRQLGE